MLSVRCQHCGRESGVISQALGVCLDCIRGDFAAVLPSIEEAHKKARGVSRLYSGGLCCRIA